MQASESPFIHFVRSLTLLATLLVVPGIAIFWNQLPRDFTHQPILKSATSETEEPQIFQRDSNEAGESVAVVVPEPVVLPPTPKVAADVYVQQVAHVQQVSVAPSRMAAPPQDFGSLELHLKALGAKYYRLEKWGNRGELFRFSCFVTPSEPYAYEKHFQAIGADAVETMRSVIADIEAWKKVPTAR